VDNSHITLELIEDDWIQNIELLDDRLLQFTQRKRRANAFDLRYGKTVMPEGLGRELCEKVLSRRDVVERLPEGWLLHRGQPLARAPGIA
jgi:hypothetical protein